MIDGTVTAKQESEWKVVVGVFTYDWRIYLPVIKSLRRTIINPFHDIPETGHFGALQTTELESRDFNWPVMRWRVRKYVSGCDVCHRIEAPRQTRHGINMPLDSPSRQWERIRMNFVTNLPESTASAYTGILVIVDRMTRLAIYLPFRTDIVLPGLPRVQLKTSYPNTASWKT